MKRILLWSMLLLFFGTVLQAAIFTKTFMNGNTYTLNPIADAKLKTGGQTMLMPSGGTGHTKEQYVVSDASAFTITPIQHTINPYGYYYTYQITAQKVGTFTFYQRIDNSSTATSTDITYTITVVDVTSISNIPESLSLTLGDDYAFSPMIIDSRATTTLTWLSSNTSVATVDATGNVSTLAVGTATITCTAYNGVSAQCVVTVTPKLANSIELNPLEVELMAGEQFQLNGSILPDNATNKTILWSSSNEDVATVNENGLVEAIGAGLCDITATTIDGSELSEHCLVKVLGDIMYCTDLIAIAGATVTLPVQMKNVNAIQGFEFELDLPEWVTVETDESSQQKATLTDRVSTTGLDGVRLENGNYKFVFTSTTRILGTEGAVVNVPLVVAENMAVGTYNVQVKNVELVKYSTSEQIHHADRTSALIVNTMTLGDVNGDGRVSVADAISIINYVLGGAPVSFITRAADVNGDNSISLADAVAVVDIILGRSGNSVKAAIHSLMQIPE